MFFASNTEADFIMEKEAMRAKIMGVKPTNRDCHVPAVAGGLISEEKG